MHAFVKYWELNLVHSIVVLLLIFSLLPTYRTPGLGYNMQSSYSCSSIIEQSVDANKANILNKDSPSSCTRRCSRIQWSQLHQFFSTWMGCNGNRSLSSNAAIFEGMWRRERERTFFSSQFTFRKGNLVTKKRIKLSFCALKRSSKLL